MAMISSLTKGELFVMSIGVGKKIFINLVYVLEGKIGNLYQCSLCRLNVECSSLILFDINIVDRVNKEARELLTKDMDVKRANII